MASLDTIAVGLDDLQDERVFVVDFGIIWLEERETMSTIRGLDRSQAGIKLIAWAHSKE